MSVQGTWELAVARSDGTIIVTLDLTMLGNVVTGTSKRSDGLTVDIMDGSFDGGTLAYDVEIQDPIPARLHFALTVSGDTLAGTFASEQVGGGTVTGKRV
jgi:hypothetical protein